MKEGIVVEHIECQVIEQVLLDEQVTDNMTELLYRLVVEKDGEHHETRLLETRLNSGEDQRWFVLQNWKRYDKFYTVNDVDKHILIAWIPFVG